MGKIIAYHLPGALGVAFGQSLLPETGCLAAACGDRP